MYFPQAMKDERRWMVRPKGKQPISALDARPMDYEPPAGQEDPNQSYWRWRWTVPAVWSTYQQAVSYWDRHADSIEGLSFVLHPASANDEQKRLVCFDFDKAFDEYGVLDPAVDTLLDVLVTFSEVSRSGRGLHVFTYLENCPAFVNILQQPFGRCKVDVLCSAQVAVTGSAYVGFDREVATWNRELLDQASPR